MWERATARMGICIYGDVREGYVIQLGREGIQDPVLGGGGNEYWGERRMEGVRVFTFWRIHMRFSGSEGRCEVLALLAGWVGVDTRIRIGIG